MIDYELLSKEEYWNKGFNHLMNKSNISKDDKMLLVRLFSFERDNIIKDLLNGIYEWSIPRKVAIKKHGTNKFRIVYIYSVKDRLVLSVIYSVLSEYFKDNICDLCYSYKTGENTSKAINVLKNKEIHNKYGVKLDIHSYFNSVSEDYLHKMIDELFKNDLDFKKSIENLMYDNRCKYHKEIIEEYKALIAGTPVASFFANYCLNELDFEFYNLSKIYARYSDDIILFSDSKQDIHKSLEIIRQYLNERGLEINPDKYEYFEPNLEITFLGLKIKSDGAIDISEHSKQKIKKYIHNLCKKARKQIEINYEDYLYRARKVCNKINYKNFKCYIQDENTYGWCHYAFRYITTDETLKEIDLYTKERLRYLKTGKNNKANYKKVSEEDFKQIGWVSLTQLYHIYKKDFDYYCEVIDTI